MFFLRLINIFVLVTYWSIFISFFKLPMYAHNSIDMLHIHKRLETVLFQTDYTRRYVAYARSFRTKREAHVQPTPRIIII